MMSEQSTHEMRYHLHIQRGVDGRLNTLIRSARALLDEFLAKGRWDMENHQLSNLLSVCGETDSAEVVIGYVQYQIGRDDKRRNWAWQDFGEALIKQLQERRDEAKAVVQQVVGKTQYTSPNLEIEIDRVWMLLIHQYTGHLRRYFVYKKG